jgi:hypothetical protein
MCDSWRSKVNTVSMIAGPMYRGSYAGAAVHRLAPLGRVGPALQILKWHMYLLDIASVSWTNNGMLYPAAACRDFFFKRCSQG